jgi:hypothetical protein
VRLVISLALVAGLLGACGGSGDGQAGDAGPTFSRVKADSLQYPDPVATVTDMLAPAADGEDWRIFGSMLEPATATSHAAVWTSNDGRGWDREDIDPVDGDSSESMAAATRMGDNGVLAVGQVGDEGSLDAAVWASSGDGWAMSSPAELGGKHDQWAFDVAYGDSGIVVAGGENAWGEVRPRLWFSPDGETWSSVDGGPGGPLDTTGEESIQAVSAFGAGFVAVGWRDFEGEQDGIAWYSADGTTWEQLDAPTMGGPGRQNVQSVAAVGNVLVAGGFGVDANGLGKPVVWRSTDGKTWSERSGVLPLISNNRNAARDMSVRELSVNGDEILAAGGDDWRPHLWHSLDGGNSWVLLGDDTGVVHGSLFQDGVALVDVGRHGDDIVALGAEPTVLELGDNNRWLDATGTDAFPTGGSKPAITSVLNYEGQMLTGGYHFLSPGQGQRERYTGSVWLGDPGDLTEIEPEGEAEHLLAGKINDLSRFKGGYVAVGFEDFSLADKRTAADGEPDGIVFTSKEGDRWTRRAASLPEPNAELLSILDADPDVLAASAYDVIASQPVISAEPAGGSGTRSLEAVAPLNDGFIAVGSVYRDADNNSSTKGDFDTDPVVAISGDGNNLTAENTGLAGPGTQRFRDVCTRDGQALAVGVTGSDNSFDVATRLRGQDGRWRAGETADGSFTGIDGSSQEAYGCAVSKEGFVVVGTDNTRGNSDARVWFSEDGVEFETVVSGSLGGSGDQAARAVAAVPDGGWLVGGVDTIGGDSDIALWRLEDGEITRRDRDEPELGGPGTQAVAAMSVVDNRAIVVGEDQVGAGMWETGDLDR